MKTLFRNVHLYLSLGAGLVIAIVCFTGATLVFEKEWQQLFYPERYRVEAGTQRVSLQRMMAGLREKVPGAEVSSVKVYGDPTRTVELSFSDEKGNASQREAGRNREPGKEKGTPNGNHGPSGGREGRPGGNQQAFVNPYTGQTVGVSSQRSPFFSTMFSLHRWLLMGDAGKMIVGVSTLLFLFILMTGIVLWWPQNKKILKQRLALRLNAGWKRLNHDWHVVLGFYSALFLFTFAFTGLAWSFKWFNDGIYWVTGTESKRPDPPLSVFREGMVPISFDQAFRVAEDRMPRAEYYTINRPKEAEASVSVTVMPGDAAHERATHQLFLDQYSGQPVGQLRYGERNLGARVRALFYPVHVGSIAGLPGRIVAFGVCLAGMTFPVTGMIAVLLVLPVGNWR
ncbi:MAG: PepSY domain-containing protein [Ferruginibacter sp.]|nr:PepSY domain-containing protein [Cytophagales bacterium]